MTVTVRTEAEALLDARGYLEKGLDNIEGFEGPWRSKEVRELMRETLAILADVRPGNALDHEKADLAIRQAFDIEQDAGWDEAIVLAVAALDKCLTLAPADGFTTDERRLVIHGLITLSQQEGVPIKDRDAAAHLAGRVARRPVRVEQTPAPAQVPDRDALSDREREWLLDVAAEGVAVLREWVAEEERVDPESADAIEYGVRSDCGERAMEKMRAGALALSTKPDPRIAAVLALHHRDEHSGRVGGECAECAGAWPCATAAALGVTS